MLEGAELGVGVEDHALALIRVSGGGNTTLPEAVSSPVLTVQLRRPV
jgi:hypothetical protein